MDAKASDSSKPSPTDEGGDPELAKRLARIATQEDKARAILKEAEGAKTELVEYRAWKESRGKDPVAAALHGLTDQQRDALYWQLNDHVLKSDPAAPKDPAEEARRVAREEWDKLNREKGEEESKQLATRMEEHRSFYVSETAKAFQADPAKWPAIRARGVPAGDIVSHVEAEFKRTGELLDAAAVLDHFQRKFEADIEAAGYTRQKVEAQPGGEKPRNGTTTVTQEWSSGAGPASAADDRSKSRRQSSEEIKRKHFKR